MALHTDFKAAAIFINKGMVEHEDNVILSATSADFKVRGQPYGKCDWKIINAIVNKKPIYMFYRRKSTEDIIFVGKATTAEILRERTAEIGSSCTTQEMSIFGISVFDTDFRNESIQSHMKADALQFIRDELGANKILPNNIGESFYIW